MNIYDVADKAGVSIATVSRVLNGSDKVKPATKQKIEQIIAENGFVKSDPHSRRKSTMCIGYIYTNFRLHASALFVEDVTRSLGIRGYRVFATCTDADFNNLHIAVNQLREHVDCFIIQAGAFAEWPSAERTFLIRLAKEIPLILMDGRIDAPGICDIRYNLSEPITNFIQTLYHKGNRNVLFIFASMSSYCMSLVDSYRHAYELLHYEPESIYTHLCPDVNSTMQYLRELISQEKLPDVVLTTNRELSYAVSLILNQNEKTAAIPVFSAEYYNATVTETLVNTTVQILEKKKTPSSITIPGIITQSDSN